MDRSITNYLRNLFLVHAVVGVIIGLPLWLVPGRTLTLLGWTPQVVDFPALDVSIPGTEFVNPTFVRLVGAALLALAFSSFQGWRASRWQQVALLVQLELVFCALGVAAFLARVITRGTDKPLIFWVDLLLLAVFTLAWGVALFRKPAI